MAVVLSLAAAGLLFGIVGAIIAVPVVASVNSAVRAGLAHRRAAAGAGPPPETHLAPTADPPLERG